MYRDDNAGAFASLVFVDGDGVGEDKFIEVGYVVWYIASVEVYDHILSDSIDLGDTSDIAVEDIFIVIVFDLHHLIANEVFSSEAEKSFS